MPSNATQHPVLIIGCGSIGERHLRCFQQTGRAAVTACDSNPALLKKVSETYKVPALSDWEAAIKAGGFDAVVICTPANWHVRMAIRALERGINVLCEKPLSISLEGVDQLLETEKRSGLQISIAYVMHVYPFLVQARAYIREGKIGPVREAVFQSGQAFHLHRPAYAQTYYRSHATGGGAIQDALTHQANWIESVIGPTDSVICDCAHQVLATADVEDTVHVVARNGEALVSYALNQFQMPNEMAIQFNAARGSVRIESHNQRWGTFLEGESDWTWRPVPVAARDTHFIAQANAFIDQIEGKPTRLCSVKDAAQTLRFNLAALTSAKTGSRVRCQDIRA